MAVAGNRAELNSEEDWPPLPVAKHSITSDFRSPTLIMTKSVKTFPSRSADR